MNPTPFFLAVAAASAFTVADLPGTWSGMAVHDGDSTLIALQLEAAGEGRTRIKASIPAIFIDRVTIDEVNAVVRGDSVFLGAFRFVHHPEDGSLRGVVPAGLLPVYTVPLTLRRAAAPPPVPLPDLDVSTPPTAWTFRGEAPFWAGATYAHGLVYAGDDGGVLHALDAKSGQERWRFRAGAAIRSRALVAGNDLFVIADDGLVRRLDARNGELRWEARVESTFVRHPPDDPRTLWDRFGADPVLVAGRLYVGTHDGRLVALDPADGGKRWQFPTGGAVLAAPCVAGGRAYFGSLDGHVYALDAATGALAWKFDARAPVVSTPALAGDRVIVGTRGYDLFALDAQRGVPLWKRYFWFSWVESSPAVVDGIAYVGSSDASALHAVDVRDGRMVWKAPVRGWAWGPPTVAGGRVYIGTVGAASTDGRQVGAANVIDGRDGRLIARLPAPPRESGQFGYAGAAALGEGLVFFPGLDSTILALPR
jgi:outer membrane protein assembly factor BamB